MNGAVQRDVGMTFGILQRIFGACKQTAVQRRLYICASAVSLLIIIAITVGTKLRANAKTGRLGNLNWTANLCSVHGAAAKRATKGIPRIFHQTYKTAMLPTAYRKYVAKCRNLNPDWDYYLWRDEDITAFMSEHYPQYVRKYRTFSMNLQRADFMRYMVLYHYGGVYLDMDVECVRPFFPGLEGHAAFLDQERLEHARILFQREFSAMNSAMGSEPGHPFYLGVLDSIDAADDSLDEAGISTGPDRLTLVYEEWTRQCPGGQRVTLLDPAVFSPAVDLTQGFHARCTDQGKSAAKSKWLESGCRLLASKDWRADATDRGTVGKHLFLHMGYSWGPRTKGYFHAGDLGPMKLYSVDRMRN